MRINSIEYAQMLLKRALDSFAEGKGYPFVWGEHSDYAIEMLACEIANQSMEEGDGSAYCCTCKHQIGCVNENTACPVCGTELFERRTFTASYPARVSVVIPINTSDKLPTEYVKMLQDYYNSKLGLEYNPEVELNLKQEYEATDPGRLESTAKKEIL